MIRSLGSMALSPPPVLLLVPLLVAAQGGESEELVEAGQRFRTFLRRIGSVGCRNTGRGEGGWFPGTKPVLDE